MPLQEFGDWLAYLKLEYLESRRQANRGTVPTSKSTKLGRPRGAKH